MKGLSLAPLLLLLFLPTVLCVEEDSSGGLAQVGEGSGSSNTGITEGLANVSAEPSPAILTGHGVAFLAFIVGVAALVIFLSKRREEY